MNQEGIPHWYVTLFATTQIRNASKASNTIAAVLSAMRVLINWSSLHEYAAFQWHLALNPEAGDLIPQVGGFEKFDGQGKAMGSVVVLE